MCCLTSRGRVRPVVVQGRWVERADLQEVWSGKLGSNIELQQMDGVVLRGMERCNHELRGEVHQQSLHRVVWKVQLGADYDCELTWTALREE